MAKGSKNGWGDAREGKVSTGNKSEYGEYKNSDVKSSRDLKGLYSEYQGKTK